MSDGANAKDETVELPAPEQKAEPGVCAWKGCTHPAQKTNARVPLCAGHYAAVFGAMAGPADVDAYNRLVREAKEKRGGR